MSNISIDVEMLGGTTVNNAVVEAKALAKKLEVAYVCFDFNGQKLSIGSNVDVKKVVKQYHNHVQYICEGQGQK